MKAEITELWDTGREILSIVGQEETATLEQIKKCENVTMKKTKGGFDAKIDGRPYFVKESKVRHQYGGTMYVVEVF